MKLNKNIEIFQLTSFQSAGYIIRLVSWLLFFDLIFSFLFSMRMMQRDPTEGKPRRKANENWRMNNKTVFENLRVHHYCCQESFLKK